MKQFFIKLISVTIAIIFIINVIYNLVIADRLDGITKIISLSDNEVRRDIREKIRNEAKDSLKKENILDKEDKVILYKLYIKIKKEFEEIELSDQ
jgi:hypothetical protein